MRTSLFFLLVLAIAAPAMSQEVAISQAKVKHNKDQRHCWQTHISPEAKEVKKAFEDYMRKEHDLKLKGIGFMTNKDVLSAEEVVLEAVSEKRMNFYANIEEKGKKTRMCLFATLGYDVYLKPDEHKEEFEAVREILAGFLKSYLPEYYSQRVATSSESVEDLGDELADLRDDVKDKKQEIEDLKQEIEDLEKAIGENEEKLKATRQTLQERKDALQAVEKALKKL